MYGMPSGRASLRMARPTVVEMYCLLNVDRLGVRQILIVVGRGHVEHVAGVAQTNRRQGFDLACFERHQHFFGVGEDAAFALGALLGLGQVVEAEHHVLRGHGDGLA